jgi:hypothetical protein
MPAAAAVGAGNSTFPLVIANCTSLRSLAGDANADECAPVSWPCLALAQQLVVIM